MSRFSAGILALLVGAAGVVAPSAQRPAAADIQLITSAVTATDGRSYAVTNHLVRNAAASSGRREWLLVWAGDENIADTVVRDTGDIFGNPHVSVPGFQDPALPGPDFLAVIDS